MERVQHSLSSYSVMFKDMDQHYKTLVNTMPGVVYALDEKGHFAYLSDTVENVLGYDPLELLGLHFSYIIHPDDVPSVSRDCILPRFSGVSTGNEKAPKLFDERRAPPRRTAGLKMRLVKKKKDGVVKTLSCKVNASGQHFRNDSDRFVGTVGVIFDFCDEEILLSCIEKKPKYNPFELLSQAMRHTFSNVFTGIYGNLQLIEMQMENNKDFKPNIEMIKTIIENAMSVVKNISKMGVDADCSKQNLFPDAIVRDTADEVFSGRPVKFDIQVQSGLYDLDIDCDDSKHIIRSILFLIRESIGNSGEIAIKVENANELPLDIPRLDCKYIVINVTIKKWDLVNKGNLFAPELERVVATSLGYLLLKKSGGLVKNSNDKEISLYLPALERL